MIRHGRSFFISLAVHSVAFASIFFVWKSYGAYEKKEEEKACIKLCNIETPSKPSELKEPKKIENIEKQKTPQIEKNTPIKKVEKPKQNRIEKPIQREEILPISNSQEEKLQEVPILSNGSTKESVVEEIQKEEPRIKYQDPQDEYKKVNTQKIARLIEENLSYPISARKKGITGLVVVKFCLSIEAKVSNVVVVESSSEVLSRAAVKTIEDLSEKFPKPQSEITLSIPINYTLN